MKLTYFIHIPKTAGESIHESFKSLGINKGMNTSTSAKDVKGNIFTTQHFHPLVALKKGYMTQAQWDNSFKFCFVRNSWERILSVYKAAEATHGHFYTGSFEDFLLGHKKGFKANSQLCWMRDDDKNMFIDFIGRYDNLNNDYKKLCKLIDVPDNFTVKKLGYHNVTSTKKYNKKNWRSYYTPKTVDIVYNKYKEEIEMFNFKFK